MRRPLCFFSAQIISFDQDGVEGREVGALSLRACLSALRSCACSQVSEAGLLSSAEEVGLSPSCRPAPSAR